MINRDTPFSASFQPATVAPQAPVVEGGDAPDAREQFADLGIVESTALRYLDRTLKQHWNLGQNILLCWTVDEEGVQVLVAPHHFLSNFTASLADCAPVDRLDALNGSFIRKLIAGSRYLQADEFYGAASRLELIPLLVELPVALELRPAVKSAIDSVIKRYSITYVKSRAVLLFDIVNFSLVTPFEQTSQLNSLSYSLNSAHHKLLEHNIEVNFSRSTTGDGYYVWHQDDTPKANLELFQFMLLVLADNAIARRAAKAGRGMGQVAPQIRSGFHIGSHFEFFQVEGLKPGMNSFIVGDVTIELARMLDVAGPGQIIVGDFDTRVPTSGREGAYLIAADTEGFVERATRQIQQMQGVKLSDKQIKTIYCFLTGVNGTSGGHSVKRFRITDKHGRSRNAYNLRVNMRISDSHNPIILGLQANYMPKRSAARSGVAASPLVRGQLKYRPMVAAKTTVKASTAQPAVKSAAKAAKKGARNHARTAKISTLEE